MEILAELDHTIAAANVVPFGELPHKSLYRERSEIETEPAIALVDDQQMVLQVDWIISTAAGVN